MSAGPTPASEKAARAASSQLNMDSDIGSALTGGNGPEASPPPSTVTPPVAANAPNPSSFNGSLSSRRPSKKPIDATIKAAPPSALRAHSSKPMCGATVGAASTSASV